MTNKAPRIALVLGWGGVIPFVGSALIFAVGEPMAKIYALSLGTIYGGLIVCFIGAVHWGRALREHHPWLMIWSVIPALMMVPVLWIAPPFRPPLLIMALIILWAVDLMATRKGLLPQWYMLLRHGLTTVASLSLLTLILA